MKKDRNASFSRFDTNYVKKGREKEAEKVLLKGKCQWPRETKPSSCSRATKRYLVLSHAVPFYQLHATRAHTTRPHTSAQHGTVNLTGILPSELLLRVSNKDLGKTEEKLRSWGKLSTTKEPRARK